MKFVNIIALAALVRLKLLTDVGTLWNDEAFSRHFALKPLGEMIVLLRFDVHPPLHAILLHGWMAVCGDGAHAVRAMSLVTAVLGLAAFAWLGNALIGKRPALLALVLAALSPVLAYYGVDGRMYPLVFLLSCLSSIFFWCVYQKPISVRPDQNRLWFWTSLALVLTHMTGIMVVAAQFLFLLKSKERRDALKKRFIDFFLIAAVFAVWFLPFVASRFGSVSDEWQFSAANDTLHPIQALTYWFWLGPKGAGLIVAFLVALLFIIAGSLRHSERRPWFKWSEEGEYLTLWLAAAFLPFLLMTSVAPRYLIAAVPPLFLLLARGFMNAARDKWYGLALGIATVLFLTAPGLLAQLGSRSYLWDRNVEWVEERWRPGDRIVFAWFADELAFKATAAAPFRKDLSRFETRGLYPFDDTRSFDERLVAHAGTLAISKEDHGRLIGLFEGADRIFFFPNRFMTLKEGGSASEALNDWFRAHGWFLQEYRDTEGRTQGVWLMIRK